MLSVQHQSAIAHRGNVIVANGNNELGKHQQQHKKKMYAQSTPYGGVGQQPASVARRNARERNRVKQVNNGFATLRQHIPASLAQALGSSTVGTQGAARPSSAAASKKLSKVETLRMAVEYIRNLQQMLDEHDAELQRAGGGVLDSPTSSQPGDSIKFELKSESGDEHYPQQQQQQQQPCSEASSSPTPSFVSDSSSSPAAHQQHSYGANFTTAFYSAAASDHYDNYEPMSPEDKVLLDYISSSYMWPQSH